MEYIYALQEWFHLGMLWLVYGIISVYIFYEHVTYSIKYKRTNYWFSLVMGLTWFIWIPICLIEKLFKRNQ